METVQKFGKDVNFKILRLTADNEHIIGGFECGENGIDLSLYLHEEAARDNECVTYVFVTPENNTIAYASISCTSLVTGNADGTISKNIPAVLIDKFAVASEYQHMKYDEESEDKLSEYILFAILHRIFIIMERIIGAKYVILYSTENAIHFYERCGFLHFEEFMQKPNDPYIENCTAMYLQAF